MNKFKQRGIGFGGIMIIIMVLVVAVIYGSQIGLGYFERYTLQQAVQKTLQESRNDENITPKKIRDMIIIKLSTNNINLRTEDIVVNKSMGGYEVEISHEKIIEINNVIKVVMDLSVKEEN